MAVQEHYNAGDVTCKARRTTDHHLYGRRGRGLLELEADAMSREEHKQQLTQFDLRQQPGRIGACNATCSIAPRRRTHVG
jgi:hypothetical protein